MATGTKFKFVVNSISYIAARQSFLINQDTANAMWLGAGFIKQIFSNLGLSTKTSFQLLKGTTLQAYKLVITEDMLQNGEYTAKSNLGNNRDITWKSAGIKFFDHSVLNNSAMLDNAIAASGVTFDDSWAGDPAPVAPRAAATMVTTPAVENDGDDHVDLDDAAGDTTPNANPVQQAEPAANDAAINE